MCCIDPGFSGVIVSARFLRPAHDGQCSGGQGSRLGRIDEQTNSGVTDTKGDKKEASGHTKDAMVHVYDHSLPTVDPSSPAYSAGGNAPSDS